MDDIGGPGFIIVSHPRLVLLVLADTFDGTAFKRARNDPVRVH